MEQSKKTLFRGTEPFEYSAEEEFCEKMSREGWMLDSLTPYTWTFVKAEPADRKFRVDIYPDAHISEKKKALDAYKNNWRKAGYKFIGNNDLYFYFCTEKTDAVEPSVFGKHRKSLTTSAVWRKELYCGLIIALVLAYSGIKLYSAAYTDFVTFSGVSRAFMLPVFIVPVIVRLVFFLVRFIKGKRIVEAGGELPQVAFKTARRHWRFTFGIVAALMIWILLGIILDACTGSPRTILLLSPVAIVAAVVGLIQGMKKRGGSRLAARVLIIIAIVLCIGAYAVFNYMEFSTGSYADRPFVRHIETDDSISSTRYNRTASPMVSEHFTYIEYGKDGSRADTEYFNCTSAWSADILYEKIEKRLSGTTVEDYELIRTGNEIIYTDFIPGEK